jgi:hypothetical protein
MGRRWRRISRAEIVAVSAQRENKHDHMVFVTDTVTDSQLTVFQTRLPPKWRQCWRHLLVYGGA